MDNQPTQLPVRALPSRKAIPPFEALRAFDAVARLGGIRKAAQSLRRDHAVISRHLKTIEDWTGAMLIERTPAGVVLTEEGKRYHQHIARAIDTIANATIDLMKRGDYHVLYSWCMPTLALQWMIRRLIEFEESNPDVDFELRPTDTLPDLERHEADIDIRLLYSFEPPPKFPSSVRMEEICRPATIAVASPGYMEQHPPVSKPEDLLDGHVLLHEESYACWGAWLVGQGIRGEIELSGPRLWQGPLTMDAARRDRGIALSNRLVCADALASGELVEVGAAEDGFAPISLGSYFFMARSDRWDSWAVRRFREWLLRVMREELARMPDIIGDPVVPVTEGVEEISHSVYATRN